MQHFIILYLVIKNIKRKKEIKLFYKLLYKIICILFNRKEINLSIYQFCQGNDAIIQSIIFAYKIVGETGLLIKRYSNAKCKISDMATLMRV